MKKVTPKSVSNPTRLYADWPHNNSRPIPPDSQGHLGVHWATLRQASDTQKLAHRARHFIQRMLQQEGPTHLPKS